MLCKRRPTQRKQPSPPPTPNPPCVGEWVKAVKSTERIKWPNHTHQLLIRKNPVPSHFHLRLSTSGSVALQSPADAKPSFSQMIFLRFAADSPAPKIQSRNHSCRDHESTSLSNSNAMPMPLRQPKQHTTQAHKQWRQHIPT